MKVFVSPSNQSGNRYAYGNTTEREQCEKIANALIPHLTRCGITPVYDFSKDMYGRVAMSDAENCDIHLPIHTNAFNGSVSGTRIYCFDRSGVGYKVSSAIFTELAPITPGTSESVQTANFYEIRVPRAKTAYVEVEFHDNPNSAKWIIEHTEDIAVAICKGLCRYAGIAYVPEKAPEQADNGGLWKVQVGAYKNKANAEKMAEKLKEAGFPTYIVKS